MKFHLLAGITLLVLGNSITEVEAQNSACGWVKNCQTITNKKQSAESTTTPTSLKKVESSIQLPEGKVSTVATLTAVPDGSAATLKGSTNSVAQIAPPTDSNGNRIFRATRSGPSFLGVGANFGLSGDGNVGDRSLVIISKLGLTETISVRPSLLLLRDFVTVLLPVTYDFSPQEPFGDFKFSPYLGGGVAINTGSTNSYGLLLTGGVDIPLSSVFTINVAANLAFLNSTDLGIVVGIGYNF
ncbi:MAG: hypothetical protein DCF19_16125 [Pseudanabaena frigida]|uniref:Outer membrane protein beta-barrel domain-containing protein n=1 Tax=Pseudanabaena frigida TaxID=945775 RepID=A0A2W4W2D9_9CYAN|nr:MAG: hypothetical protein DCF19_16125 [Pseudanabaena frigida]